jgi:glycosyltransferase involved in cell wall biosynthesis
MKVLHFYRTYFPDTQGGLEEAIRQICASTQAHGVESRVLTLSPNPNPQIIERPEADVYRAKLDLEISSCSMGREAFGMFSELAQWADVVHYHFPWPFADVVKLASGVKTPSLITYHSDIVRQRWLGKIYSPLMWRFLRGSSRIVATSPDYLSSSPILQKVADKVDVIPLGLDEKHYPPANPALLQQVESEYGKDFFLFVGVLRQYKGLNILLEAMRGAPYKAVIAGIGPLEKALKRQAKRLALDNVFFPGYISDELKVALLTLCRGIVLPSYLRSEAFGVFLLEGAMMRKPLISAEIGSGTNYININMHTGLTVPPGSPSKLRAAMDILTSDAAAAQAMGENARTRYENLFGAAQLGSAYAELYKRVAVTPIENLLTIVANEQRI